MELTRAPRAQGLVTNDVRRLQRGADGASPRRSLAVARHAAQLTRALAADAGAPPPPLYTALLSSTGRVLFDAFLHPAPPGAGAHDTLLADVASDAAPQARLTPPTAL